MLMQRIDVMHALSKRIFIDAVSLHTNEEKQKPPLASAIEILIGKIDALVMPLTAREIKKRFPICVFIDGAYSTVSITMAFPTYANTMMAARKTLYTMPNVVGVELHTSTLLPWQELFLGQLEFIVVLLLMLCVWFVDGSLWWPSPIRMTRKARVFLCVILTAVLFQSHYQFDIQRYWF